MRILFSLISGPRVVRHPGQVSWTTSGLVSASVHALTVVLLFVGGGVFPHVQVFPTQRREPTIDIVSRPAEPKVSVETAVDALRPKSAAESEPVDTPAPPENRPAETKMARRPISRSTGSAKFSSVPQMEPAEQLGDATRLRRLRRANLEPMLPSPTRSLPSSIGQTGAESKLPPVKIYNPAPQFPISAIGKFGTVYLMIKVSSEGNVVDVQVEKSSGVAEFDEAAVAAVRKWRFLPALESTTGERRCRQQVEFLPR